MTIRAVETKVTGHGRNRKKDTATRIFAGSEVFHDKRGNKVQLDVISGPTEDAVRLTRTRITSHPFDGALLKYAHGATGLAVYEGNDPPVIFRGGEIDTIEPLIMRQGVEVRFTIKDPDKETTADQK